MENPLSREYELISRVYTFIKQKLKRNKIKERKEKEPEIIEKDCRYNFCAPTQ